MRTALLLAGLLTAVGCAPRMAIRKPPDMEIVAQTETYAVGKFSQIHFLILAKSATEAQRLANTILACDKQPCFLSPGGVVFAVERPVLIERPVADDESR